MRDDDARTPADEERRRSAPGDAVDDGARVPTDDDAHTPARRDGRAARAAPRAAANGAATPHVDESGADEAAPVAAPRARAARARRPTAPRRLTLDDAGADAGEALAPQ